MSRDRIPSGAEVSRVLVVADLAVDAARIERGLAGVEGATVAVQVGTEDLLARYLEVRPDVVVTDLLDDPGSLAGITAQLGAVGFDNEDVPFLAVADTTELALQALADGARDTVHRDDVGSPILAVRVTNLVRARQLAVRLRRQRSGLADVVLSARGKSARPLAATA